MENLISWFDIENVLLRSKFANLWPVGMVGVSVYPDEVEIRIKANKDLDEVSKALRDWFGPKYSREENRIYLESPGNGKKRYVSISFEIEPEEERVMPETMKPNFSSFILYPEMPDLKGPDFEKLKEAPSIWAFYSFKGGVSRTLHLVSLVKALSEQKPDQKVLIVDADLEAPGLTWWAEEQLGKPAISYLDFLALAHYDEPPGYVDSLALTTERLRGQMLDFETRRTKTEHFFLPAFREIGQLMRMPIRPENLCWESGKEWIIPELLWKLGKNLNVHTVVVDLRAGLSEISSPLLFDPRVNRIIVTTPSGQSIEGTKRVMEQIKKISHTLEKETPDSKTHLPIPILSMIKEDIRDIAELEEIKGQMAELILPGERDADELLGKNVVLESLFDENLLYLKNLKGALDKLDGTDVHRLMSVIAREWLSGTIEAKDFPVKNYERDLKKLEAVAADYEYAESGKANNFMITQNLKAIARKFEYSMPAVVVMGPKGSGKTYTYLQLAHLGKWSRFIEKVLVKSGDSKNGLIWPLLASKDLQEDARKIVNDCQQNVKGSTKGILFQPLKTREIEDLIEHNKRSGEKDISSWREFWLRLMAKPLSCENEVDPLATMQKVLAESDIRIVFQIDGLENHFQDIGSSRVEQTAIEALCRSVVDTIQEWPDNRIGLLIFIRKDLVRSAIKQNFGQFEERYRTFELKWNREEALRLVAWLVHEAAGLKKYVTFEAQTPIEIASEEAIEKALESLWGLKLGPKHSREAYTTNWVIAALSDFNGQLQARDVVRLIRYAAQKAQDVKKYRDRLLPSPAIKGALDPCSEKKIDEIEQEIEALKEIFKKLRNFPDEQKQVPFNRDDLGLNTHEIETMKRLGIVIEYEGKYYFPEIIRRGLDFSLVSRGRLKVLNLLKRSLNR
jgi:cellulose biosynthesis protein BcsQ